MSGHDKGYEFTLRGSRGVYWIACAFATAGVLGGISLGVMPFVGEKFKINVGPIPGLPIPVLAGIAILVLSTIALRRSLIVAHECRIGDAGILTRTLLSAEQFIPWPRYKSARFSGRLLVITHDTADGITDETWVEIPRSAGATALRVKTFLADKERSLAASRAGRVTTPIGA